ncbi:MAG: stage III sporulation protein AD [Clostridia bacterium]|nr:stage III sporulation protein AD [Clostridia bacterium]
MELTGILSLLLIAAFLTVLLRQYRPELALSVGVVAGVLLLLAVLRALTPSLSSLQEMLQAAALPTEYIATLFKALGICLITQFSADACRDAGETALAAKAEFAGKVALLVLSLPLFEEITSLALKLMQG